MPVDYQGDAVFVKDGKSTTFRFKVAVTVDERLQIWLEDRESKAQWQTKQLELNDFVTAENMLTQAKMPDYATQSAGILRSNKSDDKAISEAAKDGARCLELRLALGASTFAVTLVYHFELAPIHLEKVDVLTAQMRDLKDEVAQLRATVQQTTNKALENRLTTMETSLRSRGYLY